MEVIFTSKVSDTLEVPACSVMRMEMRETRRCHLQLPCRNKKMQASYLSAGFLDNNSEGFMGNKPRGIFQGYAT